MRAFRIIQIPALIFFMEILFIPAAQAEFALTCREVNGLFTAARDSGCKLLSDPARNTAFIDLEFLAEQGYENVCSTAIIEGTWGDMEITGNSKIAQVTDPYPHIGDNQKLAIGADAITIKEKRTHRQLGRWFVRHYVHLNLADSYFHEELVMVSGNKLFTGAKATIRLHGNLFTGATMSGTLCTYL